MSKRHPGSKHHAALDWRRWRSWQISALDERLTSRIGALDIKIDKLNGLLIDLNRDIGKLSAPTPTPTG